MADQQNSNHFNGNPRVIMWCVPRSVSTALTKCMSFVEGAQVWLEPYVIAKAADDTHYIDNPDSPNSFPHELEGNEDVYKDIAVKLTLGGDVENYDLRFLSPVLLKEMLDSLDPEEKFVFVKDMGVGVPPNRFKYLPDRSSGFKHFFLIRNPIKVYKSYRKGILDFLLSADPEDFVGQSFKMPDSDTFHVIEGLPKPRDGTPYVFKGIHELWTHIRENIDNKPVILDIDDLLENPAAMLPRLCSALNIPYTDSLLTWDKSTDVVLKWKSCCLNVRDSPRYAMWFANAFKSTCFKASSTKATLDDASDDVKEIVEKEMPYYSEMHALRLTA